VIQSIVGRELSLMLMGDIVRVHIDFKGGSDACRVPRLDVMEEVIVHIVLSEDKTKRGELMNYRL
jgi:hypothetical protein